MLQDDTNHKTKLAIVREELTSSYEVGVVDGDNDVSDFKTRLRIYQPSELDGL